MIRIAVCDDEVEISEKLTAVIEKVMSDINEEVKICSFTNGYDMLESHIKFSLIFLDIEMPKLNGIETAQKIREIDSRVPIVYVTNYHDYMRNAYRVHAFDYIEKPIEYESIYTVICDYLKTVSSATNDVIEFTTEDSEKIILNANEIVTIMCGYKRRTVVVITTEKEYLFNGMITKIYETLDEREFYMPNRSCIINISMVKSFKRNENIIMNDGQDISLSKGNTKVFEAKLAQKMHEKVNRRIL
ncbi:MAG: LytTR family DNA-binding domain-containing protein [Alistipes sp.]|nr:LytTR family DNA-binding domain-containing protein [Alistipes sp.]